MTQAIRAQGIQFKRETGSPSAWQPIGEVTGFSGPSGQVSIIDASNFDSNYVEKITGLIDEGQVTFDVNLVPSFGQHIGLREDRKNRVLRGFQIVLTDVGLTTLSFSAYVTGFTIGGQVNDKVAGSVTLEISGAVTGF